MMPWSYLGSRTDPDTRGGEARPALIFPTTNCAREQAEGLTKHSFSFSLCNLVMLLFVLNTVLLAPVDTLPGISQP